MRQKLNTVPRATATITSALTRLLDAARPSGWQVGSARHRYDEFESQSGVDATRYGDWEYSGRCTDF